MREFMKLFEDQEDDSEALYAREHYVEHMVRHACAQAGIEPLDGAHAVSYDEQDNRTCTLRVGGAVTLEQLMKVAELGSNWTIHGASGGYGVEISFAVDPKHDLGK